MRSMTDTIRRLAALKTVSPRVAAQPRHLGELKSFGSNPGKLMARTHIPAGLPARAPLVVVLHGCTQTADAYDHGAGWSMLAEAHGFALLFPEQQRANNANLCFNWFEPGDIARDRGEALSIRQMIGRLVVDHRLDPARIFITGLSAGGAMTVTMLATYPEMFAGGAAIAGLPHGVATTIPAAFDRMRGHGLPGEAALADLVRDASAHDGPWPTLSIWHGDADATVSPANAEALLAQWRGLHGLPAVPSRTDIIDGQTRRRWSGSGDRARLEDWRIAGHGHGTPLAALGADACGAAGPHMLEAGISSTRHIAAFWGIAPAVTASARPAPVPKPAPMSAPIPATLSAARPRLAARPVAAIENALRAAGLLR